MSLTFGDMSPHAQMGKYGCGCVSTQRAHTSAPDVARSSARAVLEPKSYPLILSLPLTGRLLRAPPSLGLGMKMKLASRVSRRAHVERQVWRQGRLGSPAHKLGGEVVVRLCVGHVHRDEGRRMAKPVVHSDAAHRVSFARRGKVKERGVAVGTVSAVCVRGRIL